MRTFYSIALVASTLLGLLLTAALSSAAEPATSKSNSLTLVVMDPLAAPLSCPCVEGYAQRKYEVLAKHLSAKLGREMKVVFAESLLKAKKDLEGSAIDIIIGKDSVVRADAEKLNLAIAPVARLTDKLGSTTQHGLIVVRNDDPAQSTAELAGYQIIFGPAEADEKHSAAFALLTKAGIKIPTKLTIDEACSDGACKVIDLGPNGKGAAVISSYAAPLLEGCGTIKKGDLRVISKTEPVPFITAFVSDQLDESQRTLLQTELLKVGENREVCLAMESLLGFVTIKDEAQTAKKK